MTRRPARARGSRRFRALAMVGMLAGAVPGAAPQAAAFEAAASEATASEAAASEVWRAVRVNSAAHPAVVVADDRPAAPDDGLPDGRIAVFDGDGDIRRAWYTHPTGRYRHGVLGDAIEAGGLSVVTADGRRISLVLPATAVFEDITPRLADLDADGRVEVVAIKSSVHAGAAVVIYGVENGSLRERAATGFIGMANRWLNIAGIADFLGVGGAQIAHVQTPHIGGTLVVHAFRDGALRPIDRVHGFSNHVIGSRELRLSAVADVDGDGRADLAVPSADRRALRLVRIVDGAIVEWASIGLPARIDKAIAVAGDGSALRFVVGLEDGSVHEIRRAP